MLDSITLIVLVVGSLILGLNTLESGCKNMRESEKLGRISILGILKSIISGLLVLNCFFLIFGLFNYWAFVNMAYEFNDEVKEFNISSFKELIEDNEVTVKNKDYKSGDLIITNIGFEQIEKTEGKYEPMTAMSMITLLKEKEVAYIPNSYLTHVLTKPVLTYHKYIYRKNNQI